MTSSCTGSLIIVVEVWLVLLIILLYGLCGDFMTLEILTTFLVVVILKLNTSIYIVILLLMWVTAVRSLRRFVILIISIANIPVRVIKSVIIFISLLHFSVLLRVLRLC